MQSKQKHPTATDAADVVWDTTHVVELPANPEEEGAPGWEVMERGSDEHIAFLEQVVSDLQTTLAELKAARVELRK